MASIRRVVSLHTGQVAYRVQVRRKGRPPEFASFLLGHKTLAMVKRYSHLVVDHTAKVIEKMIAAKGL